MQVASGVREPTANPLLARSLLCWLKAEATDNETARRSMLRIRMSADGAVLGSAGQGNGIQGTDEKKKQC